VSDPFAEHPQVLLIRQYRYAPNNTYSRYLQGGSILMNRPKACARQELLETGCKAEHLEFLHAMYDARLHG
jgi:hypothetical protein